MRIQKERGKEVLAIIPLNLDGFLFEWKDPHAAVIRKRLATPPEQIAELRCELTELATQADRIAETLHSIAERLERDERPDDSE
ncbi:MAG: hypothetical protein QGF59_05590 [Pirellulaceae bacterium]|nr:hypothetical protein [Pirellulaceae bacterium]